jgi:hypothetical protein
MPLDALLALGWPGIARLTLSPRGALEAFAGAVAITAFTVWLCRESVRQRAEQARADAQGEDPPGAALH